MERQISGWISLILTLTIVGQLNLTLGQTTPPSSPNAPTQPSSPPRDLFFNCNRFGQACDNNSTCLPDGGCQCDAGQESYDCSFDTLTSDSLHCPLVCEREGRCVADPTPRCLCSPGRHGDRCQLTRVRVTCEGPRMTLSFTPTPGFQGKVYIGSNNGDAECFLNRNSTMIFKSLSVNASDCDGQYENNSTSGYETYTKQMNIQFNPSLMDAHDLQFNLSCVHPTNATVETDADMNVTFVPGRKEGEEQTERYRPARMEIIDSDMEPISGAVIMGQKIHLVNYLKETSVYSSLRVVGCSVTDPDSNLTVRLLQNSCPTSQSRELFIRPFSAITPKPSKVAYALRVFKLTEATKTLEFSCHLRLCKAGDTDCVPEPCPSISKRRRRSAKGSLSNGLMSPDDGNGGPALPSNQQMTRATLIIIDPLPAGDSSLKIITDGAPPAAPAPLVPWTAVLAVLCLLLTVAVIVIIVKAVCWTGGATLKSFKTIA